MRPFTLIILIVVLFLLSLLFLRGRQIMKGNLSLYMVPALLIFGILFIIIGKVAVFLAILTIGIFLIASRMRR